MSVPGTDSAGQAMRAVTLSRQYGCGGGEIAIRVARLLGWSLVDHQLVAGVATQLGIAEQQVASLDERAAGFVSRVIDSLLLASPEVPVTRDNLPTNPSQLYHEAVGRLIHEALERGKVVIVGRGGQAMLQDRPDVLHVRVVAPLAQRIAYVARREGLSPSDARSRIQHKEQDRIRYLQAHYHRSPEDPLLYDITLNTGILSLDSAAELITRALEHKRHRLGLPASQLGPGAGLPSYPASPGDIRTSS